MNAAVGEKQTACFSRRLSYDDHDDDDGDGNYNDDKPKPRAEQYDYSLALCIATCNNNLRISVHRHALGDVVGMFRLARHVAAEVVLR